MNKKIIFICLIGLLLSLSCSAQTPLYDNPPTSNNLTESPQDTPYVLREFIGSGYVLSYPSDWYAYQPPQDASITESVIYNLILSDKPENQSPQSATPDEQARVTIWYFLNPGLTLESWVVEKWAWMNTDIYSVTIGGRDALSATVETTDPPLYSVFYWLEIGDYIYIIQAYSRSDLPIELGQLISIIDSIDFDN